MGIGMKNFHRILILSVFSFCSITSRDWACSNPSAFPHPEKVQTTFFTACLFPFPSSCAGRGRTQPCCLWATLLIQWPSPEGEAWPPFSKAALTVTSHPLFLLRFSGGNHWFPTSRALRKGGWQMNVWRQVGCWVMLLFCSLHCLNPGNVAENCQRGTECAAVGFNSQEVMGRGRGRDTVRF